MRLIANLSMLFTELPLVERLAEAKAAGFAGVEIQFPYSDSLEVLARARDAAEIDIVLINVPAGDLAGGDLGLAALPDRRAEFYEAVETAAYWAAALDAKKTNILAGRPGEIDKETAWRTLTENVRAAADRFGEIGVAVGIEPVNPYDAPGFFLASLDLGLEAVSRAGHDNVHLQFDLYHMARTEPDLCAAIERAGPAIGHVQFADAPGRHEPGTGGIDFSAALHALKKIGYDDALAAEYRPAGQTEDGLTWMADFQRMMA